MLDPIRRLLAEAGKAKQTRAFWQTATEILSESAGGARVQLTYKGLSESGTLEAGAPGKEGDRKSTRLNSSHSQISYAVFCLKKKRQPRSTAEMTQLSRTYSA